MGLAQFTQSGLRITQRQKRVAEVVMRCGIIGQQADDGAAFFEGAGAVPFLPENQPDLPTDSGIVVR